MDDIMNIAYRAKSNFIHRKVAKRDILIPVADNVANFNGFIELNETAMFLWECLQNPCTGNKLCESIVEEYDVNPEKAAEDVRTLLTSYLDRKMIEEA